MSAAETPDPEKVLPGGTAVGRYRLLGHLAEGEAGSIYLAELTGPGTRRRVALRLLHPDRKDDEDFAWAFIDDTRRALRLHHSNVVQTLDLVRTDEHLGAALEFAPGLPIATLYPGGELDVEVTPQIVAYLGSEAAGGLHHAHTLTDASGKPLGIVHGDVCPANVRIGFDGRVRVADFGMSRSLASLGKLSAPHGTFAYSAPEQVAEEEFDRRADIWGLGVVLWELLARYRLFRRGSEEETAKAVREDEIPPLDDMREDVPDELEVAIRRALERDPAKRWQSAEDLQEALRRALPSDVQPLRETLLAALAPHRDEYVERHAEILGKELHAIPSLGLAPRRDAAAGKTAASTKPYLPPSAPLRSPGPKKAQRTASDEPRAPADAVGGPPTKRDGDAKRKPPASPASPAKAPVPKAAGEEPDDELTEKRPAPLPPPMLPPLPKKRPASEAQADASEARDPAPPPLPTSPTEDVGDVEVDVEVPDLPSSDLVTIPPSAPPGKAARAEAPASRRRITILAAVGGVALVVVLLAVGLSGDETEEASSDGPAGTGQPGEPSIGTEPGPSTKATATSAAPGTAEPAPGTAAAAAETGAPVATRTVRIESNRADAWLEVNGGERQDLPIVLSDLEEGAELVLRAGGEGYRERRMRVVVGEEPLIRVWLSRDGASRPGGRTKAGKTRPNKGLAKNPFGD